jgi:hypothetical protein
LGKDDVFVGEVRSSGRFVGGECRGEGVLLCTAGRLGFWYMVKSNELVRGFGRGHGAMLVVIAVAGWPGSQVFCLRLGVGCRRGGCGRLVCIGGAIVGNGVVGVRDIAAVAGGVAVLWRGGLRYVPLMVEGGWFCGFRVMMSWAVLRSAIVGGIFR